MPDILKAENDFKNAIEDDVRNIVNVIRSSPDLINAYGCEGVDVEDKITITADIIADEMGMSWYIRKLLKMFLNVIIQSEDETAMAQKGCD